MRTGDKKATRREERGERREREETGERREGRGAIGLDMLIILF